MIFVSNIFKGTRKKKNFVRKSVIEPRFSPLKGAFLNNNARQFLFLSCSLYFESLTITSVVGLSFRLVRKSVIEGEILGSWGVPHP